jgi:hypothetical protein
MSQQQKLRNLLTSYRTFRVRINAAIASNERIKLALKELGDNALWQMAELNTYHRYYEDDLTDILAEVDDYLSNIEDMVKSGLWGANNK